jgi:hypothetical protein
MLTKADYLRFRREFEPKTVELVIIAESPPENQTYFYKPDGSVKEWLFSALMEQLDFAPKTKEGGLREVQRRGWILVDATYEPVNGLKQVWKRNKVIESDYPLLVAALIEISPDKSVPIILVKKNVCEMLDRWLTDDGFNVLNKGVRVHFPSHSRQRNFRARNFLRCSSWRGLRRTSLGGGGHLIRTCSVSRCNGHGRPRVVALAQHPSI